MSLSSQSVEVDGSDSAAQLHLQSFQRHQRKSMAVKNIDQFRSNIIQHLQVYKSQRNGIMEVHGKKVQFGERALFIFDTENWLRKQVVWLTEWVYHIILICRWFERFITLVILMNTITLTVQDYSYRERNEAQPPDDLRQQVLSGFDLFYTSVFLTEFALKVVAMGFVFEKHTYLRDGWNIIDFMVVISSVLSFFSKLNLSAVRIIRILRPLRSINSVKGMRILVASLLDALPDLANVVVFLTFILVLFGILGLSIFMGATENRCRTTPAPVDGKWPAGNYSRLCVVGDDSTCPEGLFCGNPLSFGLGNQDDLTHNNDLNFGFTTFDNILLGTFTIFQALTTEGWTQLVYMVPTQKQPKFSDTAEESIVYLYFNLLMLFGSFFVVNLILAVINDSFLRANEEKKLKTNEIKLVRRITSIHTDTSTKKRDLKIPTISEIELDDSPIKPKKSKPDSGQTPVEAIQHEPSNLVSADPSPPKQDQALQMFSEKQTQRSIRSYILAVVESKYFMIGVTIIILLNTVSLSLDRYPQDPTEDKILDIANQIFTLIFTMEMVLKLIAFGMNDYFRDGMNIFDCVIVIISITDWVLSNISIQVNGGSLAGIKALRTLRLFRMFKLARSWVKFRELLAAIAATLLAISNFVVLLLLFMIVVALLGMELFAYRVRIDGKYPRENFNTFYDSMITIFVLLTNENWNGITYQYLLGLDSGLPILYFVTVVIIGNFILLKLFIAILIYNFSNASEQVKQENDQLQDSEIGTRPAMIQVFPEKEETEQNIPIAVGESKQVSNEISDQSSPKCQSVEPAPPTFNFSQAIQNQPKQSSLNSGKSTPQHSQLASRLSHMMDKKRSFRRAQSVTDLQLVDSKVIGGKSLFLFGPANSFRIFITRIISHRYFDYFIILMIAISSVLLIIDDPLSPNSETQDEYVYYIDVTITGIFIAEAAMKTISVGFLFNGNDSYLRQVGNILDLMVIIFSAFSFNRGDSKQFSQIKILRVVRILRPLRLIARNEGLKISINALTVSLQQMLNLMMVCLVFFLLFAILGVNQLKGLFFYCSSLPNPSLAINSKWDCFDYGGSWVNNDYNFDNVLNALITLFVLCTTEGWVELLHNGTDTRGIDLNPEQDSNKYWGLLYVGFIIVGSFFVVNLFAGVIVDAFTREKDNLTGLAELNKEQQEWISIQIRSYNSKPVVLIEVSKEKKFRRALHNLTSNVYFDYFILACIMMNTILLTIPYWRQPSEVSEAFVIGNWCFLGVFALECVLKIIAQLGKYFRQGWNLFDFAVVLLTLLGVILEQTNILKGFGTATSVFRSFRIFRFNLFVYTSVLRLVKSAKSLRVMFQTFIMTLPDLANIGALLSIVLFMFAVLANNLYPYVKSTVGIDDNGNFRSFIKSFFTLYRCSTGEGWNLIQADITRQIQPDNVCYDIGSYGQYQEWGLNGCGSWTGYIFFVVFQILFSMIMLNLFVAIIIEGFQKSSNDENSYVKPIDIDAFVATWKYFDKNATLFIPISYLNQFMLQLPKPLGWFRSGKSTTLQSLDLISFHLQVYQSPAGKQFYYYYDVLHAVTSEYLFTTHKFEEQHVSGSSALNRKLGQVIAELSKRNTLKKIEFTSAEVIAAMMVQRNFKAKARQSAPKIRSRTLTISPQEGAKAISLQGNKEVIRTQQDEGDTLMNKRQSMLEMKKKSVTFRN